MSGNKSTFKLSSSVISGTENDWDHKLTAKFDVTHMTPGREGTILKIGVDVILSGGKVHIKSDDLKVSVEGTTEDALLKYADWLERTAEAIRNRTDNEKKSTDLIDMMYNG